MSGGRAPTLPLRQLLGSGAGPRETNRRRILVAVMIRPDTQTGLARRTLLSQATVSSVVKELREEGAVEVDPAATPAGGGRGALVRLKPVPAVAVGVYVGFTETVVVARRVDREHGKVAHRRTDGGVNRGLREVLPALQQSVAEAVAETGRGLADVGALGVAVSGMVHPRVNRLAPPVLPPWSEEDDPAGALREWLAGEVGVDVPVVQDNDANLAALGEHTYATEDDAETLVYVKASTGVGAGMVIGNRVFRGQRGLAGEIGHLTVRPGGRFCYCGGRGCLETVIGGEALLRQVAEGRRGNAADLPHTLPALVALAKAHDPVCLRVLTEAGHALGFALAQLCNVLNPNLVVLGGQLVPAWDLVRESCWQSLHRHALRGVTMEGFRLKPSALGARAEAQGALVLGLSRHELP